MANALFTKHFLHDSDARQWSQSNCSVDLWIELMNHYGFNPVPLLGFTLAQDYEQDQFSFVKFSNYEIEKLYGLQLGELSIFTSLENHVSAQVIRNNVVLVEVDGFYLPDTKDVSYQIKHTKTTIGINKFDSDSGTCSYFHNDTYATLSGEDFNQIFRSHTPNDLFPYVEFVKIKNNRLVIPNSNNIQYKKFIVDSYIHHRELIPSESPIRKFRSAYAEHVPSLTSETFHDYAFNNFRMLGANFELMADYLRHVCEVFKENEADKELSDIAVTSCIEISTIAKRLQFKTARMVARNKFDFPTEIFDHLENHYNRVIAYIRD